MLDNDPNPETDQNADAALDVRNARKAVEAANRHLTNEQKVMDELRHLHQPGMSCATCRAYQPRIDFAEKALDDAKRRLVDAETNLGGRWWSVAKADIAEQPLEQTSREVELSKELAAEEKRRRVVEQELVERTAERDQARRQRDRAHGELARLGTRVVQSGPDHLAVTVEERIAGQDRNPHKTVEAALLGEAITTINGDRLDQYGSAENSFPVMAELWSAWLTARWREVAFPRDNGQSRIELAGTDVAMMMTLYKIGREANASKRDNRVDAAGYIGLYERCLTSQEQA